MKYKDEKVREILKEFRSFNKWASKGIYAIKDSSPEAQGEYLKQRLREILQ